MKKIEKWKLLDSEYLIRRPWLTARRDCVQLPDGTVQYRHGLQDVFMELVAGTCEQGEDPLAAAQRELLEETGYAGGEWTPYGVLSANPTSMNNLSHIFLATGVERVAEQHLDDTEDIAVHLLTEQEVLALLRADRIKQALMAAPLWKYFATRPSL